MEKIKIIKANLRDFNYFYSIRNQKSSVKNSKFGKIYKKFEYRNWFKQSLKKKDNKYFLAKEKKKLVGYIRFDKNLFYYKISIAIDETFQNQGYGKKIFTLCQKKIGKNKLLISEVKNNNKKSINFFETLGFIKIQKNENWSLYGKFSEDNSDSINYEKFINQIENKRKANNVNWMNLLKLCFRNSPSETKKIFNKINKKDKEITKLSKKLIN